MSRISDYSQRPSPNQSNQFSSSRSAKIAAASPSQAVEAAQLKVSAPVNDDAVRVSLRQAPALEVKSYARPIAKKN